MKKIAFRLSRHLMALYLLLFTLPSHAQTTLVAVAANFSKPIADIADAFEKATGHTAKLSLGSSGKFVSQIENGAPFEVFLSADESAPQRLEKNGYAVADSHYTYAIGRLVLWSATQGFVDNTGLVLTQGQFAHIAIADPKLAPYGAAAVDYLQRHQQLNAIEPRIVMGENIAQTYQLVASGNAELGFVALSQVIDEGRIQRGSGLIIPPEQYNTIKQNLVLLTLGKDNPAAQALVSYMKTPAAQAIIRQYGYDLP